MEYSNGYHIFAYIGFLFIASQISGRVAAHFKAPRITGYLISGIIFGPSLLGFLSQDLLDNRLDFMTDLALALIAFAIGTQLEAKRIAKLGRAILGISFSEALCAFLFVFLAMLLFLPFNGSLDFKEAPFLGGILPIAILLGALCIPTAPAAVLNIVQENRSKGMFITVLLGVVALDDMIALLAYAFASAVATGLVTHESLSWEITFFAPFLSILTALLIGAITGLFLRYAVKIFPGHEVMIGFVIGSILLVSGLALLFNASPLLANMVLGFIVTNYLEHDKAEEAVNVVSEIGEPIYGVFFMLAGAHLNLALAPQATLFAVMLVVTRFGGKLTGCYIGASATRAPETVKKYMGLALLPSAGVTMALTLKVQAEFSASLPHLCEYVVAAVVINIFINELIAPFLVRFALLRAQKAENR